MEITCTGTTGWIATRRGNMVIFAEQRMTDKVLAIVGETQRVSVYSHGQVTALGNLIGVDLSPEALLEDLDIEEGQSILLLPKCRDIQPGPV